MNRIKAICTAIYFILMKRSYKMAILVLDKEDRYDAHVVKVYYTMERAKIEDRLRSSKKAKLE